MSPCERESQMCLMQEGDVNVRTSTRTKMKPHDPGRRSSKVCIFSYGGLWLAIYDRYNMWHGKHPHNCPGLPRTVISDWSTNETMRQALALFHRRSRNHTVWRELSEHMCASLGWHLNNYSKRKRLSLHVDPRIP